MSTLKNAAAQEFTAMIEADRKKKQAQTLANKMLGSGRRSSAPGRGGFSGQTGQGASLASRVGVTKRSASSSPKPNIEGKWGHDLHRLNNPRPAHPLRNASASQVERGDRLYSGMQQGTGHMVTTNEANAPRSQPKPQSKGQMSIRGMANPGPFVVIASNFAIGTTAADIEAAMAPVGGEISGCYLLSAKPNVMAEVVFVNKEGAENVVATFNNQKADGKQLYVYMKQGGPTPRHIAQEVVVEVPAPQPVVVVEPIAPVPALQTPAIHNDQDAMDVDEEQRPPRYDGRRERNDQRRANYDDRRPPSGPSSGYDDGRADFRISYDRRDNRDYQPRDRDSRGRYGEGAYRNNRNYRPQ